MKISLYILAFTLVIVLLIFVYWIVYRKEKKSMNNSNWIESFDTRNFRTPFIVDRDSEYLGNLRNRLDALIEELSRCGLNKKILEKILDYKNQVINSIELYYQGDLVNSQLIINKMIYEFNDAPAITNINNSIAFPGMDSEVQFFRARLSENVKTFEAKDMLHIPFDKRSIVQSARFSIPGLPCLYLGNTTYVCWIEMGNPADHRFNVSPILLDNTQKVLNLTVTTNKLYEILALEGYKPSESDLHSLLKLMILTLATSYRVNESNRTFKSEYIISQMIMLACKNKGLDGITYYSKRVDDEAFASTAAINLVLFAKYNGEEKLSEALCNHLEIDDSFNFSMFKQLLPYQCCKEYDLRILSSPYINNIGSFKRQIPYKETQFFEFDKYLFANWDRRVSKEEQ